MIFTALEKIDNNDEVKITSLDAIELMDESWEKVTDATTRNCFRKACFSSGKNETEDDLPLPRWLRKYRLLSNINDIESYGKYQDDKDDNENIQEEYKELL